MKVDVEVDCHGCPSWSPNMVVVDVFVTVDYQGTH